MSKIEDRVLATEIAISIMLRMIGAVGPEVEKQLIDGLEEMARNSEKKGNVGTAAELRVMATVLGAGEDSPSSGGES